MLAKDTLIKYSLFDAVILHHGFAPFMRDYDVIAEVNGANPGRYLYRFTHCPKAMVMTRIPDEAWRESWDDLYTDYENWEEVGAPAGFVWGVRSAVAYPGLTYIENSKLATQWSERFHKLMHEVRIETQVFFIVLIFHDVNVSKLNNNKNIIDSITISIKN